MKAFVFSIGETTTDICIWSLKRLGFVVVPIADPKTSFYQKYLEFLSRAKGEETVIRCDADVVVTKDFTTMVKMYQSQNQFWWFQGKVYCHLKHNLVNTGPNIMNDRVISVGLQHFHEYKHDSRPETRLSRAKELMDPRRYMALDYFTGIHGFRQREEDIQRVFNQKAERDQLGEWDLELIDKMGKLEKP